MKKRRKKNPQGIPVAFVTRITLRNGRRLYAADYGLKAFPLKTRK